METNEVKVEKEDGKVKKLEKQVNGLCAVLRKLKTECEKHWGVDIDGDGKIGSIRVNALLLLLCVGMIAVAFAAEQVVVSYPAPEGTDAVLEIMADDGDDAADKLELIMTATGSGKIDIGGTTAITLTTSGSSVATVAATAAITLTDSDSNAVITATGYELSDASLVLDADQGDDNADTWTIKSAAGDNNLDFINHTTEAGNLTAAGVLSLLGGVDAIGAVDFDIGSADVLDVTIIEGDSTVIIDGGITVSTGDKIQVGSTQWNSGDSIDGEQLAADSVDDDSIDFADVTGADFTLTDCTVITATGTVSGAELKADGKYAVTGGDATTGLMVLAANVTMPASASVTQSFAVVFGAAPVVTCTYTEDPVATNVLFVTSVTASNFVCTGVSDKNFGYIAVGQRP